MSAWIVSENHIRLLVEALYKYEVVNGQETPEALGQRLWDENHASVNYRYDEQAACPRYTHASTATASWEFPEKGAGSIRTIVRNPALVYKQVRCYEYQSCEHEQWESSVAAAYMRALKAALIAQLGTDRMNNNQPWGID